MVFIAKRVFMNELSARINYEIEDLVGDGAACSNDFVPKINPQVRNLLARRISRAIFSTLNNGF